MPRTPLEDVATPDKQTDMLRAVLVIVLAVLHGAAGRTAEENEAIHCTKGNQVLPGRDERGSESGYNQRRREGCRRSDTREAGAR